MVVYTRCHLLVLGTTRDSPKSEIAKSYRKLAGKWHPCRSYKKEEKAEAAKTFMTLSAA
jgi:DnaJ-class molecular chaperone